MLTDRHQPFVQRLNDLRQKGWYPYFRPLSRSLGPEVFVEDRRLVMLASNDYLGLTVDPRVVEAASEALSTYGAGPGGSRFLCGSLELHRALEERLADFVGKKAAVVHTTGFLTNHGVLGCLAQPGDSLVLDRDSHASIVEGARASGAKIVSFAHNDMESLKGRLNRARTNHPDGLCILVSEGVFSMSGDVGAWDRLAEVKREHPEVVLYLDDAHGLGVMGPGGHGTAAHFGVTESVDLIMGTFSKAFASIGGFVATDDLDLLGFLQHNSRTLIFSAALPAVNVATALKSLEIIESEPDRVERLWRNAETARAGYKSLGFDIGASTTPVIPICIGDDDKAYEFSNDLFDRGVFALPAVHPAVPKGQAIIRTAFMSTHEDHHLQFVLDVFEEVGRKHGVI